MVSLQNLLLWTIWGIWPWNDPDIWPSTEFDLDKNLDKKNSYCWKYDVFDLEMTLTLVFDLEMTLTLMKISQHGVIA